MRAVFILLVIAAFFCYALSIRAAKLHDAVNAAKMLFWLYASIVFAVAALVVATRAFMKFFSKLYGKTDSASKP